MHLQADEPFGVGLENRLVGEVGDRLSVDPGLDPRAFRNDAEVIPLAIAEHLVRFEFLFDGQPTTAGRLAVDISRFGSARSASPRYQSR